MKLINWNIGSLRTLLFGKSTRALQTQAIVNKIRAYNYDWIGFQEVKLSPAGPNAKEMQKLNELFPGYRINWRASQSPAKTSYAGTMVLTAPNITPKEVAYPNLIQSLDLEGRIIRTDFDDYVVINAYVPHYEYHNMKQHQKWMTKLTAYLAEVERQKPVIIAGDLSILPARKMDKITFSKKKLDVFQEQYQLLLKDKLVDAYQIAPNNEQDATWWAPNVTKKINRGVRTDFWFVSSKLKDSIIKSGPLDTGERRDHAPITLELNLK